MAMMNIITQKIVFGGKSLANFEGKTVFIPFALPGEELRVETVKSARDYDEAKIVEIIKPSPHRVTPKCPLYQKCGGCNFMHIESAHQIELKKQIMNDVFLRAGIELPPIKTVSKNPLGYRARMELKDGGLQERGSNNAIAIENCPIAAPQINEWLEATPIKARPRGRTMIFGSENAMPKISVVELNSVSSEHKQSQEFRSREQKQKQSSKRKPCFSDARFSTNPVELALCGKKILFDAKGFFQSNIEVLEEAIPIIMNEIKSTVSSEPTQQQATYNQNPAHCSLSPVPCSLSPVPLYLPPVPCSLSPVPCTLDLYSGCGTFSVFLADIFQHVTMVEHNKGAVAFAEQNMTGKPHSTYAVSGANFVKYHAASLVAEQGGFNLAFADPPRSGMEKEVCEWLCKSDIPAIAYLSCDPSTQARDVAKLTQSGYNIKAAYLLDFYPQTSHIETFLICIKK